MPGYHLTARVPVFVKATDEEIICNSGAGYHLYGIKDGVRRLIESHIGAVKKPNPYRLEPGEAWEIIAR